MSSRRPDPVLGSPWFSPVEIPTLTPGLKPSEVLYFAGSCFAENLYRVWRDHFLPGWLSPFGSTYNPVSLAATLGSLCRGEEVGPDEIFEYRGLWRHSRFNTLASRPEKDEFLNHINFEIREHRKSLKTAARLVITLGTAFVYRDLNPRAPGCSENDVVNNCHQRPAAEFCRSSLSPEEIAGALKDLKKSLEALNPACTLIITLSPVRHMRDGAAENSLSKALLRCGIQDYLKDDESALYFPSYEILLDELRDYRWYDPDLCHPSAEAASYIAERFFKSAGSRDFHAYLKEARKIKALNDHRLRFPGSREALDFINRREARIKEFLRRYPFALSPSELRQPPAPEC